MVLQRCARAVVSNGEAEDRTVVHQRLAVLRQVQQSAWSRRTDSVEAQRQLVDRWQPVRLRRGCSWHTHPHPLPHRRQRPVQVLRPPHVIYQQGGRHTHRRRGLRERRRCQLLWRWQDRTEAELPRLHGLQPRVVRSRSLRPDPWWRKDQQPRPISGAVAADQWSDGGLGNAVLHRESGRSVQGMGHFGYGRLHAEPVLHLSPGVQPSRGECSLLHRTWRCHTAGRKHRRTGLCRSGLDSGSSQQREPDDRRLPV